MNSKKRYREKKPTRIKLIPKRRVKNNIDFLNSIQVPLSNKFNILHTEDDENIAEIAPNIHTHKIAPVIVTDVKFDAKKITNEQNISFELKLCSIGQKIFFKTMEEKNKFINTLKVNKVNFFSHPDENKTFKAVLSGLPEIQPDDIINSLSTEHGIIANKVIMFNTNKTNKLYLCHFDKQQVNMKSLNNIKAVYHHIIKWLPYKPNRNGPTQCYRCCMFGHGISACMRYAVCMLCSGNHLTNECTNITKDTINPKYKC